MPPPKSIDRRTLLGAVEEIERRRAVVAKFEAELGDWHDCARIDAKMSGPVLMGWDRRQLDRCWEKHIRNRPADQTGGEG
jgi:hypothetical protein